MIPYVHLKNTPIIIYPCLQYASSMLTLPLCISQLTFHSHSDRCGIIDRRSYLPRTPYLNFKLLDRHLHLHHPVKRLMILFEGVGSPGCITKDVKNDCWILQSSQRILFLLVKHLSRKLCHKSLVPYMTISETSTSSSHWPERPTSLL